MSRWWWKLFRKDAAKRPQKNLSYVGVQRQHLVSNSNHAGRQPGSLLVKRKHICFWSTGPLFSKLGSKRQIWTWLELVWIPTMELSFLIKENTCWTATLFFVSHANSLELSCSLKNNEAALQVIGAHFNSSEILSGLKLSILLSKQLCNFLIALEKSQKKVQCKRTAE